MIQRSKISQKMPTNYLKLPVGKSLPQWKEKSPPPKTNMQGSYCFLEPLTLDAHSIFLFEAFCKDKKNINWTYLPYGPFENHKDFKKWLLDYCLGEDPLFFVVIKDGLPVGMESYLRIKPAVGVIEIGHIHFSPTLQKTRASVEAVYLMMKRVFDEMGYRRFEWKCDSLNKRSCEAAKKFGFQFEGVFRQLTIYKGRNRDTAWFSIIDKDWERIKQNFEKWLDEKNFDESGKPIVSLRSLMA